MMMETRNLHGTLITLKAVGATGNEPGGDDLDEEALNVDPSVLILKLSRTRSSRSTSWIV